MVAYMEPLKSYEEGSAVQVGVKVEGGVQPASDASSCENTKIQIYKYTKIEIKHKIIATTRT